MPEGSVRAGSKAARDAARMRRRVRELESRLKTLEQEKDAFVSIVSHELRTPLAVIKGYLDLASEGILGEIPPRLTEPILKSKESADRLHRLIENLLEVSRLEDGRLPLKWKSVSVHSLLSGAVSDMESQLKRKKLRLKLAIEDGLPLILADEEKMRRVLDQLLANAVTHSPAGEEVVVESGAWKGAGENAARAPSRVFIGVANRGEEIPPGMREKIFERFRQVEPPLTRRKGGSGLGLYYCKNIVELHGGRIWVESGRRGTVRFVFTLALDPLAGRGEKS
ncbi:MAG: HAMP domain-containing sensor histidine kinase [bacterium]